ncbi:carbohydrate kinase [Nakamurella antarctica]|uniref:Carbohydrate kinase n=1 Tax=Nakamurella antarctica TaxID=1902245 RepID=A0A3G8ZTC9_9ACTN|nr:carbohydrate kinase [Nakamurella antarctica]AZI57041.1 carbohydrate kinase [Nakamurella antarctica]
MTTIAVVGEIVADAVLPADGIRDGAAHLTVHPGGGPANFAVALARLGTTARFAGRISTGALGQLCKAHLEDSGVDLTASVAAVEPATLAIAKLDDNGAASYEFYVSGTADWAWTAAELGTLVSAQPEQPVAIHTGTLALALQPSGAVIENLLAVQRQNLTVSIDPNLRTLLVPVEHYRARIDGWAKLADIVRLSEDDLIDLWPGTSVEEAAQLLHAKGVVLVVISLGADGAFASLRGETVRVPVAGRSVVDTVGAGDSFHGGLLHYLAQAGQLGGRLESLTRQGLQDALEFASRVAAITVSRAGANPPWSDELD